MAGSNNKLDLLTPGELAEILKISKTSVYRLVEKRAIPFCKIGGLLRFSFPDVSEYVSDSKIEPVKMQ